MRSSGGGPSGSWQRNVVAAQLPISTGSLDVLDPTPAPDQAPTTVRAVLRSGSVSTALGEIDVGDLKLVNDGYDFFAG